MTLPLLAAVRRAWRTLRSHVVMHARYAAYVLAHKAYVLRAGWFLRFVLADLALERETWWRWYWRLLRHDASKFRPGEWRPYAFRFYGETPATPGDRYRFQVAWLRHIHRNPHHWQHWLLTEDSGKRLALLQPAADVDEMVADWLAAGPKARRVHSLAEATAETVRWYVAHSAQIVLRGRARDRAEALLAGAARLTGVTEWAQSLAEGAATRGRIELGPPTTFSSAEFTGCEFRTNAAAPERA